MKVNDILYTKDGRKTGNAIITGIVPHLVFGLLYIITTDYGNVSRLTVNEVEELFYTEQKEIPEGYPVKPHKYAV